MKINTKWDLQKHYYNDLSDPRIETDIVAFEKACADFAKKYTTQTAYLSDPEALKEALELQEKIEETISAAKPLLYLHYRSDLDAKDTKASALMTQFMLRLTKSENQVLFFELRLGKIAAEKQKEFLESPLLSKYRYSLQILFQNAKHSLSEPEEKILNLVREPAGAMWVKGVEQTLNKKTVKWKGKDISLGEASNMIRHLRKPERKKLSALVTQKYIEVSEFAAAEMNAIVTLHKVQDELRGLKSPESATILSYENKEETVAALRKAVSDRVNLSHRFYKLKAQVLGEKKLAYFDRAVSVGKSKKNISFEEAYDIVRTAFSKVDPDFEKKFVAFFQNGQVDVFPRTGKTSGAYCSGGNKVPTFILLNHIPDSNSVTTLAHEMGHAIHTEYAKKQPSLYQDYSFSVAETASTLFENFAFEELYARSSPAEQKIMLFERVSDSMMTIFRQIACFHFELELHKTIREKGTLPREEIAALLNKHMAWYLGDAFALVPEDGYSFVMWSHIRRFFYVYSYAFGELVSNTLFANYQKNPKEGLEIIKQFMSAGGSASPEHIFKAAGLDITKPAFWNAGLDQIESRLTELEKMYAKKPKGKKKTR